MKWGQNFSLAVFLFPEELKFKRYIAATIANANKHL